MKAFFSRLMKGIETTRSVVLNTFFLFIVIFFIFSIFSAQPTLPDRMILRLNLDGSLVEQVKRPDFGISALTAPEPHQVKVHDVISAIKRAAKDERVVGLSLNLEKMDQAALPHLQEIRAAIESFKESEKPVVAYADNFSQAQYFLAATADHLFLHPMGNITINGYSLYRNYIRDVLQKLEVDVHVFKAGKYKSAAAPLVQSAMSEHEREANKAWLDSLWTVYKDGLMAMRGIEQARVQQLLDAPVASLAKYDGDLSRLFVEEGLVDGLRYADQADAKLLQIAGNADFIDYKQYLVSTQSGFIPNQPKRNDNWVAVVTGSGQILAGEQPPGTIGSDSLTELLRTALDDERVKAVVLRLNTPGGSALASESIRHAVEVLRSAGKPVVVSMGSMAASGGYWIATAADEIWASPATITGSIGVFGIVPNIHRSLKSLGIQTDGLGTTKVAGTLRLDKALSPELSSIIQSGITQTYQQFIDHVANGRDMSEEEVEKVAQGRVWSGADALKVGLVDQLGDIDGAIKAAARLARIESDHEPVILEPPMNPLELMIENMLSEAAMVFAEQQPSALLKLLQTFNRDAKQVLELNDPRGIYALSELDFIP